MSTYKSLDNNLDNSNDNVHDKQALKKEFEENIGISKELYILGEKFNADKAKLEAEIDKTRRSRISDEDKRKIIAQLNEVIHTLQEQYNENVTKENQKVYEKNEGLIKSMQEQEDKLRQLADNFSNITMEVAITDASSAANVAVTEKRSFESLKNESTNELKHQREQEENQKIKILNRPFRER